MRKLVLLFMLLASTAWAGNYSVINTTTVKWTNDGTNATANVPDSTHNHTVANVSDIAAWTGNANITTLGTIGTGVWNGTTVKDAYIASAATWNAKGTSNLSLTNFSATAPVAYDNTTGVITITNNTNTTSGVVKSGVGQNSMVWKTDANGNPDWRADSTGGSQTPWTSDIDGGGYNLTNVTVNTTKNITANFFNGNGSLLTGIATGTLPANLTPSANNFTTGFNNTTGAWTIARPSLANLSDAPNQALNTTSPVTFTNITCSGWINTTGNSSAGNYSSTGIGNFTTIIGNNATTSNQTVTTLINVTGGGISEFVAMNATGNMSFTGNITSNITMNTLGTYFKVKEGANATMGASALTNGNVTISTNKFLNTTRVFLSTTNSSGTVGFPYVTGKVSGTSFNITSTSGTDNSTIVWLLVEPAS
jgi:hypothetical protein